MGVNGLVKDSYTSLFLRDVTGLDGQPTYSSIKACSYCLGMFMGSPSSAHYISDCCPSAPTDEVQSPIPVGDLFENPTDQLLLGYNVKILDGSESDSGGRS